MKIYAKLVFTNVKRSGASEKDEPSCVHVRCLMILWSVESLGRFVSVKMFYYRQLYVTPRDMLQIMIAI